MPTFMGGGVEMLSISVEGPSGDEANVAMITEPGEEMVTELDDVMVTQS